jgi:hypothetical protein
VHARSSHCESHSQANHTQPTTHSQPQLAQSTKVKHTQPRPATANQGQPQRGIADHGRPQLATTAWPTSPQPCHSLVAAPIAAWATAWLHRATAWATTFYATCHSLGHTVFCPCFRSRRGCHIRICDAYDMRLNFNDDDDDDDDDGKGTDHVAMYLPMSACSHYHPLPTTGTRTQTYRRDSFLRQRTSRDGIQRTLPLFLHLRTVCHRQPLLD